MLKSNEWKCAWCKKINSSSSVDKDHNCQVLVCRYCKKKSFDLDLKVEKNKSKGIIESDDSIRGT